MLRQQLNDMLKTAMRAKELRKVSIIRLINAALKDRDIQARSNGNRDGIPDSEILGLLQSMVKQRRDSIEAYSKGGRADLAQQEAEEIACIETFLPKQLSADEVDAAINKAISKSRIRTERCTADAQRLRPKYLRVAAGVWDVIACNHYLDEMHRLKQP